MKAGWEIKKLSELCIKITDGSHNPPRGVNHSEYLMLSSKNIFNDLITIDEPRYLTPIDFNSENRRTDVETGDVLLTIVGTIGRVAVVTANLPKFTLQRSVAVLKVKKDRIDPRFLMFSLQNILEAVTKEARGVAQKGLYLNQIKNIEIPVPTLLEQQRIVKILDEVFEKTAKAKENAQKNLQNPKNLFESFLSIAINNPCKDWKVLSLEDVCRYDKTPNKSPNLPYVGLEDIESNTGNFIGKIEPKSVKSLTFHFTNEHVLYGRLRPYLNKVLLPNFEGHCSTEIFPIKPDSKVLGREYLFHWLKSKETMEKINATWTGATLPRANMNFVLGFKINVPTLHEQENIVNNLNKISTKSKKLEDIYHQKTEKFEELKKSILSQAFSGNL